MCKEHLFESCTKKPEGLFKHFQDIFTGIASVELEINLDTYVGSYIFNKIHVIEEINVLMRLIKSRWWYIQETVISDNVTTPLDILSAREFINLGFKNIIKCMLLCDNSNRRERFSEETLYHVSLFLRSVKPVSKLNENILLKITLSKSATCPYYQYLHTLLEVHYYVIVLHYVCGLTIDNTEKQLKRVMSDLVVISKVTFKKCKDFETAIPTCSCVHFFWLVFQLTIEKVDITGLLFWRIFNNVLNQEPPLFALSFLKEIALIQCFNDKFEDEEKRWCERIKPNYQFLELKMKELLAHADCETLIYSFRTIQPLTCGIWLKEGKIEIFQIIWDFYSKRLNVSNKSFCTVSAIQLTESLDAILTSSKNCTEDFEMFISLLLSHLNEYPLHWGKMKGRIYSQLGPNKIKDLSEIGIKHVILLFLALSNINFKELQKKMLTFLESLPQEKKFTPLVWNIYAAIMLKYVREGRSIETIAPYMLQMLQEASMHPKMFHLIKEFIKNMEFVVNNSLNMHLHQWLLLGPWLGKYQSVCHYTDLAKSLEVILLLLDKCSDADSWPFWETCFKENIYINLKQLVLIKNPPNVIGRLVAKLALLCTNLTNEAFNFFNSDTISPSVSLKFLEVILDNYPDNFIITPQQESVIVRSWVKICFLTLEQHIEFTKNVMKLDIFPPSLKFFMTDKDDPMDAFIKYLGNNSKQFHAQTYDLVKLCELSFGDLDKVLGQYIKNPESENIILKSYHYVSLAFSTCGNLLYNRNKSVTILTKLVEALILPMDFMIGKITLHCFIQNAIKRTWFAFFKGLMKLSSINDLYIERTLKDMIVKYMPYFSTSDSPIVNCLHDPTCAELVLDKMYISYFKPPTKESDANVLKALKIIADLINSTISVSQFKLLISKMLYGLFEVVIFHPQRSTAIGVIKNITALPFFQQVKLEFKQAVSAITEKNLGLNTINYFQLMICLAKFVPQVIREMLEDIKLQLVNVERLKGVGFDQTLRTHFEKLENTLQSDFRIT